MPPQKLVSENSNGGASGLSSPEKNCTNPVGVLIGNPRRSKDYGRLALLLEMPIEIFTEIACYMTPLDLLNLARTSTGLRELLMSKSSKRIWEGVRLIHDIPHCPEDLNEAQYADLLFGKDCSFCSATQAVKPYFALRFRACEPCFEEQTINDQSFMHKEVDDHDVTRFIDHTMIPWAEVTYIDCVWRRFAVLQLREVTNKAKELSENPASLQRYLSERQKFTSCVLESVRAIEQWLERESSREAELKLKRRLSIERRLGDLGFHGDDVNDCHDDEDWKWEQLFHHSQPLTDKVWQSIRPQLERTIQLRRTFAGHRFYNDRRAKGLEEMRSRFEDARPILSNIYLGSLLTIRDFLELPIVNEVVEEDGCRLSLTDERWQHVEDTFPNAAQTLVKTIEKDCAWEFKDSVLQTSRDDLRILFKADTNVWASESTIDEEFDRIPGCLLSAMALFKRNMHGITYLESFTEILLARSNHYFLPPYAEFKRWGEEPVETSPVIISTALRLLEHLRLPKETTLAFMSACRHDFRCLRCTKSSMTHPLSWSELVHHFVSKTEVFERLRLEAERRNFDVPIRNAHDLNCQDDGTAVVRSLLRTTVDIAPTCANIDRYSTLSTFFEKDLGSSTCPGDLTFEDSVAEYHSVPYMHFVSCRLCQALGHIHEERTRGGMCWHMMISHGTDLEGKFCY
ncbi:hypothetical protein SCHPADRAFT_866618 [Schizopora paradoxa]|uniref:F-box domain-containing protein n=1 Tax=Schizopora paradoxa TaxID=27342 RepID=A0A0H2S2I4_9AGAM|nr:hypothetical protein SCHPADRAFT_866618 [Schizopora paradoxa]